MKLLLTGAWASARDHVAELEAMGHSVCLHPQERDPLPCDPAWVEGVVCNGLFLHHNIDDFPALRLIQLTSAGLDRVPLERIRARGIRLSNARGVYSVPMAEFALSGVLTLYKQSRFFTDRQRSHSWEKRRDLRDLNGKSVTILGCGSVGTECAKRFAAFGCRVTGVDLFPRSDEAYEAMLPLDRLDEVLSGTDLLVLTRMDNALAAALQAGRLSGAVLDVFETEPLQEGSPLWDMDNVILTPHNSFVGEGNDARLSRLILERLREAAQERKA